MRLCLLAAVALVASIPAPASAQVIDFQDGAGGGAANVFGNAEVNFSPSLNVPPDGMGLSSLLPPAEVVPEPGSVVLLATGLLAVGGVVARRRKS